MKQCSYLWEFEYTYWLHLSVVSLCANVEHSSSIAKVAFVLSLFRKCVNRCYS